MKFQLSKELLQLFPNAKVGCVVIKNVDNKKYSEQIGRILSEYAKGIIGENERMLMKHITSWDNLFRTLGIDPEETLPSHKALLKRAIAKGEIPSINSLVNAYNYISLKYRLPVGGHDMDKFDSVVVGKMDGTEKFQVMNSEKFEKINVGEFGYIDEVNKNVLTRNLVWRQGDIDKTTEETKNIFIPIDDMPGIRTSEELEKIACELCSIITSEIGGNASFSIANKYSPEIELDDMPEMTIDESIKFLILQKRMDVITDEKRIDEVLSKGVKDCFPSREEIKKLMLSGKRLRLYTGIDPTANFIHMGHMIWMKKLSEFQKLGHEVYFLIGGFTAMIGDPDKQYTRQPLTHEQVNANFQNYKKDASRIIDFDMPENPIRVVNNYEWLSRLNLEDWLGIMSNATMQHLLSHDMFRQRIETQTPIRLHEMMYPLMQGYDSVHMEVDLEVGGSDQTFNMLTGRILSRNILGKEKFVLTMKLQTDNSGKKMGKTTNNAISFKDNPQDVYGKIMSFSDEIIPLSYELLSSKTMDEIDYVRKMQETDPMQVKKDLAHEITTLMYSTEDADKAAEYFEKTIQNKEIPDDIPEFKISNFDSAEMKIIDILDATKIVASRAEAKRLIQQKGVKVDGNIIESIDKIISLNDSQIIQAGKRKWIKLVK